MCEIIKWLFDNLNEVSVVIDFLCMIATTIAVIVAIVANKNASKSLNYSLRIHEQSKNIDLFDKRVSVISEIETKLDAPKLGLQLLFDENIMKLYDNYIDSARDYSNAQHNMRTYEHELETLYNESDTRSPFEKMKKMERQLNEFDNEKSEEYISLFKEFKTLCDKNIHSHLSVENDSDLEVYDFIELSKDLRDSRKKYTESKKILIEEMKSFVQKSISPIQ